MSEAIVTVYYSIQPAGSFGVVPSPINSPVEKAMAEKEAQQTVVVTWGDLRIVVYVCGDIDDLTIHQQVNQVKQIAVGNFPPGVDRLARSRYSESGGQRHIADEPVDPETTISDFEDEDEP